MPPIERVFHRNVAIHLPVNHGERKGHHFLYQRIHCLTVKFGVKSPYYIQVALQCIVLYHTIVPYFRAERLIRIRTGESGNGRQQFHGRGRPGELVCTVAIQRLFRRQVINGYANFGRFGKHLFDK